MADAQATLRISAVDETRAAFQSIKHNLENLKQGFEGLEKLVTFGFLGREVKEFAASVIEAGTKFERSQNLLAGTLKATGYQAGITSSQVNELAEGLSKATRFDDDDLRAGMTTLVRLGAVSKDTLDDVAKATTDVAAAMGSSFSEASAIMGRALQGDERSLRALKDVMPKLSDATIFQVQAFAQLGERGKAAALVLEQIQGNLSGIAASENTGLVQATADLSKAWDDLKKAIASTFAPAIIDGMKLVTDELRRWESGLKAVEAAIGKIKIPDWLKQGLSLGTPFGQIPPSVAGPVPVGKTPEQQAAEKAEEEKAKAGAEKRKKDDFANLQRAAKERIELTRAANDELEKAQAESAKQEEAALRDQFENGLVDAETYYKRLEQLQRDAIALSIANNEKLIAAQKAALGSTLPNEQGPLKAAIAKEQGDIRLKRQQAAGLELDTERKLREETKKLIDGRNELDAKIAEQEGRLEDAAKIRLGLDIRRQQELLGQLQGPERGRQSQELLDYGKNARALIDYQKALRSTEITKGSLANSERDISSELAKGEITTQDAIYATDAARQQAIATLRDQIAAEEAALASKTKISDEERLALQTQKSELKALEASAHEAEKQMRTLLEDSLIQPLDDLIHHTRSAKEAFLDFAKNVENALLRIAEQNVAEQIFGKGGGSSGGGLGGLGGLAGGAAGYLAGLFGAGSQAAITQAATVQANQFVSAGAAGFAMGGIMTARGPLDLRRYAGGGIASSPQLALFGEGSNPEAYVPLPDGRRIPVAISGRGGHVTQHLTVNIQTPDVAGFQRSQRQVLTTLALASQRALARR